MSNYRLINISYFDKILFLYLNSIFWSGYFPIMSAIKDELLVRIPTAEVGRRVMTF